MGKARVENHIKIVLLEGCIPGGGQVGPACKQFLSGWAKCSRPGALGR